MTARLIPSALAALLFTSCLLGPNFTGAPEMQLPVTWVNALPPASDQQDLDQWWESFSDPQLTRLIHEAYLANPDVISAMITIDKALSTIRSTRSDLLPQVGISAGGGNSGNFDTSTSHGSWDGALSASWTPDIWGKTRREMEAAVARLHSARAAEGATRTALAGNVATAYFQWISAKESLRIAQEQLEYQERTYRITIARKAQGFEDELAVAEARTTIANTRATIPSLEAQINSCENTLATYIGTTVDKLQKLRMPSPAVYNLIPRVPTNLPSELLRRRPDIIGAEYDLHADVANIGVQVANLFPSLSLTGSTSAGSGSDFAHFFSNSAWNLGASASTILLNRTTLNENVTQAKLSAFASVQNYRKVVLAAFAEVEECLIEYAKLTNQLPQYTEAAAASKKAAELSLRMYNAGEANFLNVAAAERSWLSAELNVISTRQQIRMALARLCVAMGGGWKEHHSRP